MGVRRRRKRPVDAERHRHPRAQEEAEQQRPDEGDHPVRTARRAQADRVPLPPRRGRHRDLAAQLHARRATGRDADARRQQRADDRRAIATRSMGRTSTQCRSPTWSPRSISSVRAGRRAGRSSATRTRGRSRIGRAWRGRSPRGAVPGRASSTTRRCSGRSRLDGEDGRRLQLRAGGGRSVRAQDDATELDVDRGAGEAAQSAEAVRRRERQGRTVARSSSTRTSTPRATTPAS